MACGAVVAASRSAFVPAAVLAAVSVGLAAARGGVIPEDPKADAVDVAETAA